MQYYFASLAPKFRLYSVFKILSVAYCSALSVQYTVSACDLYVIVLC